MSDPQANKTAPDISCEECRELLSDYVDQEMDPTDRQSVEHHLRNCVKCGTESQRMIGLKKVVQVWDGVPTSGQFRKAVMDQMIRESQQMPALQFNQAAAKRESEVVEEKALPPVWILLVASVLCVAAYYVVLWLRNM